MLTTYNSKGIAPTPGQGLPLEERWNGPKEAGRLARETMRWLRSELCPMLNEWGYDLNIAYVVGDFGADCSEIYAALQVELRDYRDSLRSVKVGDFAIDCHDALKYRGQMARLRDVVRSERPAVVIELLLEITNN